MTLKVNMALESYTKAVTEDLREVGVGSLLHSGLKTVT